MDWNIVTEKAKSILAKIQSISKVKVAAVLMAFVVAATSVGAGGYIIYDYETLPMEMAAARVVEAAEPEEEPEAAAEVSGGEHVKPMPTQLHLKKAVAEDVELSLVATSIEKDLKIKIQNQNGQLVTGEQFEVGVKPDKKNAKETTYKDEDKDGIIYIKKIDAGKYSVELKEIAGYVIKNGVISTAVKDKIEYKKVEVADEIKKESEVNAAAEDTASNNVPDEGSLQDTLPLLDSKTVLSVVAKSDVKAMEYPTATVGEAGAPVTLTRTVETLQTVEAPLTSSTERLAVPLSDMAAEPAVISGSPGAELSPSQEPQVTTEEKTASISLPSSVTLYVGGDARSNSVQVSLSVSDADGIIEGETVWSVDKPELVSIEGSGKTVTLKASAGGEAMLTATVNYTNKLVKDGAVKDEPATAAVTCAVHVATFDGSAPLTDKNGNQLYLDEGATKPATMNDYDKQDQFYGKPKYQGWQTLNGKVYYYKEDGSAATGQQVIGGVMYNFSSDGSLSQSSGNRGIDVSKYQGNIDWGAVAASGINFAIIRVGYRGSSTGVLVEDPYFKKNIAGATRAGIKVGVYFFTQAVSEAEAVEEASMAMSLVSGYRMTYPIFIDTESASNGRANGLSKSARTAVVKAFCQTVRNGGYKAGVYASKSWFNNQLSASSLSNYYIWVAQYSSSCTYSGKKDIWQYSSKGSVSGIKGNVDMNTGYTSF